MLTITATLTRPQSVYDSGAATGKIDLETIPALRDAFVEARRDDNGHLVIDLPALTLMDAADLYAVFEALDKHNVGGVVTSQP